MKNIVIVCFWISKFLCTESSADSLQIRQVLEESRGYVRSGQFQKAAVGFEFVAFHTSDKSEKASALMAKADCYLMQNDPQKALMALMRIPYNGLSDSLMIAGRQKTALAAYLNKDFALAESQVMQALAFAEDSLKAYHLLPIQLLALNEMRRWPEAKSLLVRYIKATNLPNDQKQAALATAEKLYQPKNYPIWKDPEKAKRMSMFLPGLGQLYSGHVGEGVLNVAFQTIGIGLTAVGIYYRYYAFAGLIGLGWFQKFYSGGVNRSAFLAEKYNYEKSHAFNAAIRQEVLPLMHKKKAL